MEYENELITDNSTNRIYIYQCVEILFHSWMIDVCGQSHFSRVYPNKNEIAPGVGYFILFVNFAHCMQTQNGGLSYSLQIGKKYLQSVDTIRIGQVTANIFFFCRIIFACVSIISNANILNAI
jgi:hypothetical protein